MVGGGGKKGIAREIELGQIRKIGSFGRGRKFRPRSKEEKETLGIRLEFYGQGNPNSDRTGRDCAEIGRAHV